ncbi:MAG: hypothetical protein IPG86_10410 [Chitinophagaceae bacterium]|nr:hypothetical protein [Chitinophagaceae bacterium]
MEQEGNKIRTFFDCIWNLKEPGAADVIYAKIWLPYLSDAIFSSPTHKNISDWSSFYENRLQISTSFGTFQFYSSTPFKIRTDANLQPGEKDYTRRAQHLILYEDNIPVTDSPMLSRAFFIEEFPKTNTAITEDETNIVKSEKISQAWQPHGRSTMLLPQPKSINYQKGNYIIPENKKETTDPVVAVFREMLKQQWLLNEKYFPVIRVKDNKTLPAEGYLLSVNENGISIQHHTSAGFQHALHTLVQLVKNENGQLIIPAVKINDWPSVAWRGIHMFTGPTSWPLHKRMYDRILFPLKMNKVVLQCEQAKWKSRPELHNSISVPLEDLKKEFEYLRKNFNEPIPLIQSLGHMEWFLNQKKTGG